MDKKYKINNSIKKADLFFIGIKKILLLFPAGQDVYKENHEIGFVNDNSLFIPEFILEFNHNVASYDILNKFLKNDFPKFISNKTKDNRKIKDIYDKHYGQCHRIIDIPENKVQKINNNSDNATNNKENIEKIPEETRNQITC